jgi:CcmD family protein
MNWWLVAAYTVFFVGFSGYTYLMGQRQKDLDRRIKELLSRLDDDRSDSAR